MFIRSNLFRGSWNWNVCRRAGVLFAVPAIRRLYPENNDARKQAIKRHLEFFNTHPTLLLRYLGVTLAMEEQRANGAEIDDGATGRHQSRSDGTAGWYRPDLWGTVRPVFAALCAGSR
ncbi:PTS system mannose/fructose/sorbose family transporter subunit IID [Klebsiella pneumoniae]|nr:PTS system mannose/fructose/sorbose family transporter subunit IID [Klebsiella pneumoniae]